MHNGSEQDCEDLDVLLVAKLRNKSLVVHYIRCKGKLTEDNTSMTLKGIKNILDTERLQDGSL